MTNNDPTHQAQTDTDCLRPKGQSGPDSQTDPLRLIIPEEVVMQPRITVAILVLQTERLVHVLVNPLILFQMTPAGVVAEP